jgi:hypothetical protein
MGNSDDRLEAYARRGLYPNVSPCPVGCRFCYERHLQHYYPRLRVQRIKHCTGEQLDRYTELLRRLEQPAYPSAPVTYEAGTIRYRSASDFFSQGMSPAQLERIAAQNDRLGQAPYFNTTGKNLDHETVRSLSERFPSSFRVRLSALTFDDDIKGQLIPGWPGSGPMKRTIPALRQGRIYLLCFGLEQTLADLDTVQAFASPGDRPTVVIAPLHHNSRHPSLVKSLAKRGLREFEALVAELARRRPGWSNIADIFLHHPAGAFTWRFRRELRALLAPYRLGEGDVVICSVGAHETMQDHVVRGPARAVAVRDGLGGSTTFTTTLTTDDIASALEGLRSRGEAIRRALVPSTVWWIEGERCLGGELVETLRRRFPEIEIVRVEVPPELFDARLTLDECVAYYSVDLPRTAALRNGGHDDARSHAHPLETVTRRGYIRRFSRGPEADPLDPGALDRIDEPVRLSYDELLVHRDGQPRRETALSCQLRPRALARFRSLFVDGRVDDNDRRYSPLYLRFADYEVPV